MTIATGMEMHMNQSTPPLLYLLGLLSSLALISPSFGQEIRATFQMFNMLVLFDEELPDSAENDESNHPNETEFPVVEGFTCLACEEDPAAESPQFGGPWWQRPKLTGNWFGHRDHLAENGLAIDVLNTNFYQGVTDGGRRSEFAFGGRLDYYLKLDGQKAGLWEGFFLDIHGTTRYGDDINAASGLLSVPNTAMLFPSREQDSGVTSFKFTQALSENVMMYFGKVNFLEEYTLNFTSSRGINRFMNVSLVIPTVLGRTVPYSTYAAGFVVLKEKQPVFNFMVYDPVDYATNVGLDDLFDEGAAVLWQAILPVKPLGLPGHQILLGTWSSRSYTAVDRESFLLVPSSTSPAGASLVSGEQQGSWSVVYAFDQYLWVNPCNDKQGFGMFGHLGISDGNPNPVQWFANLGFGGNVPLRCRSNDSFGFGYFYLGLSDDFKDLAPNLLPQNDEHGFEMFYTFQVTPWCHLTADLQIVNPANQNLDNVIVPGFRGRIDF